MCLIARYQAASLCVGGEPAKALSLVEPMIPLAEQAGLSVGWALLLSQRGRARVELGDSEGITDMRDAAASLAQEAHADTFIAHINLASLLRALGHMADADSAYDDAERWANRFAVAVYTNWVTTERAIQAYHAALWSTAEQLLAQAATADPGGFNEHILRGVRGRLLLAQGDVEAALHHASAVVAYGEGSGNDEFLFEGLMLQARCHHSKGTQEGTGACNRFLTRWREHPSVGDPTIALCELALVLAETGRRDDLRGAAQLLPEACRWRDALLLTADQRYAEAADVYTAIGSRPLAADAHLLAAGAGLQQDVTAESAIHIDAVLAFAEQTGATLYRRQAERLTAASA
jgi:ATP/maltotriose-dependent transcriptional regulator MalT